MKSVSSVEELRAALNAYNASMSICPMLVSVVSYGDDRPLLYQVYSRAGTNYVALLEDDGDGFAKIYSYSISDIINDVTEACGWVSWDY